MRSTQKINSLLSANISPVDNFILRLPQEIFFAILLYLSPRDILALIRVNRYLFSSLHNHENYLTNATFKRFIFI